MVKATGLDGIGTRILNTVLSIYMPKNFNYSLATGNVPKCSTITAVLDVSETILEHLDKNNYVGAVLIDFKRAFDTVDHNFLF